MEALTQTESAQRMLWAREHPVQWIARVLDAHLWGRQADVANAVATHRLVAVRSSNAVGKTFVACCIAAWWLMTRRPTYVLVTSSSWLKLKDEFWPELRHIVKRPWHSLPGELHGLDWTMDDRWACYGLSPNEPENFGGYHSAGGVLVIVDEASALLMEMYDAIMGVVADDRSKVLLIGNPLRPEGPFWDAFRAPEWHSLHISALESPNVVEGREVVSGLATRTWVEERKREWGEGSPAYQARVLGEFPESGDDVLVPLNWCEAATERTAAPAGRLLIGVDVARYGTDLTVLVARDDAGVRHSEEHNGLSTMETAGRTIDLARRLGVSPSCVFIDDAGVGGGVVDRLHEQGFMCIAVNAGSKASDSERFANLRAEMYWGLREALNPDSERPLFIPQEFGALALECSVARKKFTSKGQVALEQKDEIKKRIGHSPDRADALALTYALPVQTLWIGK